MFNFNKTFINTKSSLINIASKRVGITNTKKNFASMAKFNYEDPLNLEGLLTEEEKMVNKNLYFFNFYSFETIL